MQRNMENACVNGMWQLSLRYDELYLFLCVLMLFHCYIIVLVVIIYRFFPSITPHYNRASLLTYYNDNLKVGPITFSSVWAC